MMTERVRIQFPPFVLDLANERLLREDHAIDLRPKSLAVLRYLLERPGRLVKKDELLDAVWPDTAATDSLLKGCVREIRMVLGDDATAPRYIETAHRRGYRFIAPVSSNRSGEQRTPLVIDVRQRPVSQVSRSELSPGGSIAYTLATASSCIVGRETELQALTESLEKAVRGNRQVVFVTGEAGIGKTSLTETFLDQICHEPSILFASGHCLEQYGSGEAYLPVLEALARLCSTPGSEWITRLLGLHAPTWLAQMPSLMNSAEREAIKSDLFGATPERMLREMAEALDAITARATLVLVLEDLHWSDYSTLDLITALSRRPAHARLLLIGTYRPMDVMVSGHPIKGVKQELLMHGHCAELVLSGLTETAIAQLLDQLHPANRLAPSYASLIHKRTEGHPLFVVNLVDYLASRGAIAQADPPARAENHGSREDLDGIGIPDNIKQTIEQQVDQLAPEERLVLEGGSVAGIEFSAAAVAVALERDVVEVEEKCETLARRGQFLRANGAGEWPDGTVSSRYQFRYELYQNVIYQLIPAARRLRMHLRLEDGGLRIEDRR
jgi:predicted ATPase/DNA-binding winged helix-turn-helix (wHTH) protein